MAHVRSVVLVSALALACGGGGTAPPPPPPPPPPAPGPPATLSIQVGDNQSAKAGEAVAVRPAVKVVDAGNRAVPNVSVTFAVTGGGGTVTAATPTTDASGIATVGSWTLGLGTGANTVTASISGAGVAGNPVTFTATALANEYQPAANTTLNGVQNFTAVTIPAGVTVTMTADVVLNVAGPATIAGSLVGDCKTLRLTSEGALTVTGTVNNRCSDPTATAVPLTLIGKESYDFEGATIESSGDIAIVNDPARVTTGLPAAALTVAGAGHREQQSTATFFRCQYVNTTLGDTDSLQTPARAAAPNGNIGNPGAARILACGYAATGQTGGSMRMNNFTVFGQSGADGGAGLMVPGLPSVTGGDGGAAGAIVITADDDILIDGPVTLRGGSGGRGGDASITGVVGTPGQSVLATSGNGGGVQPKNFTDPVLIQAGTSITVTGSLAVVLGRGGRGGDATAIAGDGANGSPGGNGGNATVAGGNGGASAPQIINSTGAVIGIGLISIAGGAGGNAGTPVKRAGNGGKGVGLGAAGGRGGNSNILPNSFGGGPGLVNGHLPPVLASGRRVSVIGLNSKGGNAGNAEFGGGNGGDGAADCPNGTGGAGGAGGDVSGGDGIPGSGSPNGLPGTTTITNAGNGGRGGDGLVRGAGGAAGANATSHGGGGSGVIPGTNSFQAGTQGNLCAGAPRIIVGPLFGSVLDVTTTQANLARIPVIVNITTQNFTGPVTLSQSSPDPGITSDFISPTIVPVGTNSVTVTLTVQNATFGDHTITFSAAATVNGNPVNGQGTFTIHIPGLDPNVHRYAVTIAKDPTVPGTDHDNVELGTKMTEVVEVALLKEMIGITPRVTVWGLMINHVPVTLVRSGSDAFDQLGNFMASALPLVPVACCGNQPSAITITGNTGPSSITFKIRILPTVSATFQFGHVDYAGIGPAKP